MAKILSTEDGTSTLFLDEYDQAMHSISGAYQESMLKHVIPSRILERKDQELHVLDAGFGLGYNVLALICKFAALRSDRMLHIISLEKERSFSTFMDRISFNDSRDEYYKLIKKAYSEAELFQDNLHIRVIFGDARKSIQQLKGHKFHAVFQDPFSPSRNPEMWSVDYFKIIAALMDSGCIITTYSSADHIRMAMKEAGLFIGPGPSVGKKREGTIASNSRMIEELDESRMNDIIKNIKSEPYRDPELVLSREEILNDRIKRMNTRKKASR